ncbi:MBL fold metallo-hydrolase [Paenarthrobacter sp. NPDC058040]|uniref:MBL fold metallo-hydrolase n=1 Tax=unclassified Paenarthrobacter TaxID=2634190 RepID=UPI0036DF0265
MDPRLYPLAEQDFDILSIDIVVNTHLHFDHCGGNHLFGGKPFYVQRQELDDVRNQDDYTIREWVALPVDIHALRCNDSTYQVRAFRTLLPVRRSRCGDSWR